MQRLKDKDVDKKSMICRTMSVSSSSGYKKRQIIAISGAMLLPASLLIIFSLLIGCGTRKEVKKDYVTIKFACKYNFRDFGMAKSLVQAFEKDHSQIKVKLEPVTVGQYQQKIMTRVAGGDVPDVMWICDYYVPTFAAKKAILNLEPLIKNDPEFDLNNFYSCMLPLFRYQGDLYGLPFEIGGVVFFYNKDLFEQERIDYPDETWDWQNFLEAAKRLTKDIDGDGKIDQFGYLGGRTWFPVWSTWVRANGGDFLNKAQTECILNSPEAIEALQFAADLIHKYHVAPTSTLLASGHFQRSSQENPFINGKFAMMLDPTAAYINFQKVIKNFKWGVAPLPKKKRRVTSLGAAGYAICQGTKHPQEAWEFLKYIVGEEGQMLEVGKGYTIPCLKSIIDSPLGSKIIRPEDRAAFLSLLKDGCYPPLIPQHDEVIATANRQLELLYLGKISASEACRRITKEVNEILRR